MTMRCTPRQFFTLLSIIFIRRVLARQAHIFINAGGPEFRDESGVLWQSDAPLVKTGFTSSSSTADIRNTDNPTLYQTKRWGHQSASNLIYEIPISQNGEYNVVLHFCESQSPVLRQGRRGFDVYMENNIIMSDLDVYKEAGGKVNVAVVKNTTVSIQDGSLSIEFRRNPIISGIEIHRLLAIQDEWIDMNENENYTGRHECSFVQAGEKFFLFGGRESPRKLEIYDYAINTWSEGGTVPKPLNHFQATEYEGLIWVIGAFDTNSFPLETPADHVYVYDPAQNVWMQGPPIPRPRGAGGLVVYDHKFYLLGGNTIGHAGGFVSWLDEYNPWTGQWNILSDAPHARDHFHAAVVGDKLYAAGGRRTARNDWFSDTVAQVDVYDFTLRQWLSFNLPDDLPIPRAGTTAAVVNDQIIILGGESVLQEDAHSDVHVLDPINGTWSRLASLHHGRHGTQAIASGQGIYVTAGSPNRGGGNQRNMEVHNQDSPEGEPSVAGTLKASSVDIGGGAYGVVTIRHSNTGNQGVFVTNMSITGQDALNFQVVGGYAPPFLIPRGGSVSVIVRNTGDSNDARAWLNVPHSGKEWLSIPLGGGSVANSTPTPLPPDLSIKSLILVDALMNRDIVPLYMCHSCITSDMIISIRAEPNHVENVWTVAFSLLFQNSTLISRRVEQQVPYTLFGDSNGNYQGQTLEVGEYTIAVQASDTSGHDGPMYTETFVVTTT